MPADENWKATKENLNHRGTSIRVFRACFRAPFLPPFFPHSSSLFPLQALQPSLTPFSPLHLTLYPPLFCDPKVLLQGPETSKVPQVVKRGCKRSFGPKAPKSSCTGAEESCTCAKQGFGGAKRLLRDLCSLGPKHFLHPLLTTLGTFEVSGPCSRTFGSQPLF